MKRIDFKTMNEIISRYDYTLDEQHENSGVGSLILCMIFMLVSISLFLTGTLSENDSGATVPNLYLIGISILLFVIALMFGFITKLFNLLEQIKILNKIILFKMGDHIDEYEV